jgi:hypothetical protein
MPLNESLSLEQKVECVRCRIEADSRAIFTAESGNHFCLTCWLEKDQNRFSHRRLTIVEL